MKYVLQWDLPPNVSPEHIAQANKAFESWRQAEGVNYQHFVGRLDSRGGFAVLESDDVMAVARDAAFFTAYYPGTLYPVIDIAEFARISSAAIDLRSTLP